MDFCQDEFTGARKNVCWGTGGGGAGREDDRLEDRERLRERGEKTEEEDRS